ncbi:sensor histidine kinase [Dictyobacter arantiisoli]|uniref:histidine kinase n=1 Tax=Dictyobacter arantiisoli TaxID=2014874 RepID=A0A5A5TC15_9CHLR|nr:ATP-binding protein [Dictyobacter arantiisoli]GCF08559.1 hypothetical protein KDI_21230 [Dictyobacter arantiisoli]
MRVVQDTVYVDKRGRRYKRMNLEQRVRLRKDYIAHIPGWRHPLIGYLVTIPATVVFVLCILYISQLFGQLSFAGSFCVLPILFAALFWGVGPALLAIVLNAAALYYFFVMPAGSINFNNWNDMVNWRDATQLLPFIVSGLVIALITAQRERARLQAMVVEQDLQLYAQELEESNRLLEDANQMKDQFLSIASHELKTPITTIRGQAQLTLRKLAKQKKHLGELDGISTALERINEQTSRLTALIDELMDVSSMRTGKVVLHERLVNISDLCREVVEDQRLLTERTIELQVPVDPVPMLIDSDRMTQVLTNLVSNALKYSPDKSVVEVCVKREGDTVLLVVQDHGCGIAKDQQDHIFESFYRTPDAQSSSKRGLGLGLAITKDIVERHQGRIRVESEPGHGSTFMVEIPIKA